MSQQSSITSPHIGNMLKDYLRKNRVRRGALARHLKKSYSTVFEYQNSRNMHTHVLWKLCTTLRHNFFMDLAAQLPPDFSTNAPDPTEPLQKRIAAQEEEIKLLNAKLETLMAVVQKG